eukprot:841721_1
MATTGWYTYAAAYIDPNDANYVDSPSTQVEQLSEVACRDIFPTSSPSVQVVYKSGTYNSCWHYAPDQATECYDPDTPTSINDTFYPPVAYSIVGVINWRSGWTKKNMKYCTGGAISVVNDWSECNVTGTDPNTAELKNCIIDSDLCNRASLSFIAIPMGWECKIPDTPEPTTASPTTYYPTTNPTTSNPT